MGWAPMSDLAKQVLLSVSEKNFQDHTVIPMAQWGRWSIAHTSDSRRIVPDRQHGGVKVIGDSAIAGYPDLTLSHPDVGIVIVELKKEQRWSWRPGQREWLDSIAATAAAQADWVAAAEAHLPPDVIDALGPMPRVYAGLWRPGDIDQIEDVLLRHRTDTATWWPDHRS